MHYPVLTNTPIIEALIDIRVKLPSNLEIETINSIYESIKEQYPEKKDNKISKFTFFAESKEEPHPTTSKVIGYTYISSDKKQILQTRLDGFTLSRLHPYVKWDEFKNEAYRLWKLYSDIVMPEAITRVALRYINNLKIPMPIDDFGDYLKSPPIIPSELPQKIDSFLNRIVIDEPSINAKAIIIQALEQFTNDVAPVILDIDVFRFQPEGIEEKEAWELIEKLRNFKNNIFFNSLTKKLKEQYK